MSAGAMATVAEVADVLGVSRWLVYERIREGEIPVVEVGRAKRIPRAWLVEQGAEVPNDRLAVIERRLEEITEALTKMGPLLGAVSYYCLKGAHGPLPKGPTE